MNSLIDYLFTGSLLLLLLGTGYFLFLRNQKLLLFTRIYLLGSLLLSLCFPLLPMLGNLLPEKVLRVSNLSITQAEQLLPELVLSPSMRQETFSTPTLLLMLYIGGALTALVLFLIRFTQLLRMLSRLSFQPTPEGHFLAHTSDKEPTFSFFRYLAINQSYTATDEEYQLVLQHEKAHAGQLHSADVLLAELAQIVLWFHPAVYILNKALRQTHEHLADAAVLQKSNQEATYIALMAKQGLAAAGLSISSNFFQSFTINRIRMIKKHNLPSTNWRIAGSMLLAASLTVFVACEKQTEALDQASVHEAAQMHETTTASPDASGVYEKVEQDAQPVGGLQEFMMHLYENINYPKEAVEAGVEGTAYISFVVDEQGNVESAESLRPLGFGLDKEAIRVLKTTTWTPAQQDGKTVKQRKVLPVKFQLNNEDKQQTSLLFKELLKIPEAKNQFAASGKGAC